LALLIYRKIKRELLPTIKPLRYKFTTWLTRFFEVKGIYYCYQWTTQNDRLYRPMSKKAKNAVPVFGSAALGYLQQELSGPFLGIPAQIPDKKCAN